MEEAQDVYKRQQIGWLERIESQLLKETVLNRETFDSAAVVNKGGYKVVNKVDVYKRQVVVQTL